MTNIGTALGTGAALFPRDGAGRQLRRAAAVNRLVRRLSDVNHFSHYGYVITVHG